MHRYARPLIFMLLMATACATVTPSYNFLLPRNYCRGEIALSQSIAPKTQWLALDKTADGWWLTPATVKLSNTKDKKGTERETVATPDHNAQLLLSGKQFREGPVYTFQLPGKHYPLAAPSSGSFTYNEHNYEFGLRAASDAPSALVVRTEGRESQIGVTGETTADATNILWMGDIDHDGRPDMVVRAAGAQGEQTCLYLTGNAADGELYEAPVCLETGTYAGC